MTRFDDLLSTACLTYPQHIWELSPLVDDGRNLYIVFNVSVVGDGLTSLSLDAVHHHLDDEYIIGDQVLVQVFPDYTDFLDLLGIHVPLIH